MGWTGITTYCYGLKDIKEALRLELSSNGLEMIDYSFKLGEAHSLHRIECNGHIFAMVTKWAYREGELFYKCITQDMGPFNRYPVSKRMLKQINCDKNNDTVQRWIENQDRMRDEINRIKRLKKKGTVIKFETPLKFNNGTAYTYMRYEGKYWLPLYAMTTQTPFLKWESLRKLSKLSEQGLLCLSESYHSLYKINNLSSLSFKVLKENEDFIYDYK